MQITYSAILEQNNGNRKIWRRDTDYQRLADAFHAMRLRDSLKNERWLGGYITSESVNF